MDQKAIQLIMETMLAMSLSMFGEFSGGTLQANIKEYEDKEMYLKWEDKSLNMTAPLCWITKANFNHWKGYLGIEACSATTIGWDVTGVFEGFMSPEELFLYTGAEIWVKSEFSKAPVFVKCAHCGLYLQENMLAPHQLTGVVNIGVMKLGSMTQYLMNHGDCLGQVLENHYTDGLKHFDLVGLYSGDISNNLTELKKNALEKQKHSTQALGVLVCHVKTTNPLLEVAFAEPPEQKMAQQEEEEEALKGIPSIQSLTKQAQEA
ncbi:hypothetical protein V565_270450 [Rhizoctonia solani 123E]|uniref:Uncharacterized protein n=1 Tax=Rhizoctonia solani 123E TaxID=1423351 RepID=A0A074S5W1_9AGAM|nr:hypothetical protein V565_270450 [Rhizoctonia solani 123E]